MSSHLREARSLDSMMACPVMPFAPCPSKMVVCFQLNRTILSAQQDFQAGQKRDNGSFCDNERRRVVTLFSRFIDSRQILSLPARRV